MFNTPSNLPSDVAELQAIIALRDAEIETRDRKLSIFAAKIQERDYRIEKLKHELADACGGSLKTLGEDVTEELEYVPGRLVVNRIIRPRMACSCCEQICQAPLPSRPIEKRRPGPGLLAHVLVNKFSDHLPLYRQSQIFEREGIDLDRSTLADWVGKPMPGPSSMISKAGCRPNFRRSPASLNSPRQSAMA